MWDISQAKTYLGIAPADTAHDVALQRTLDVVMATAETLLGRGLLFKRQVHRFADVDTQILRLPRYPIGTVYSVNSKVPSADNLRIQHRVGWIELIGGNLAPGNLGEVLVDYDGGFNPLPSDLDNVLWSAFSSLWASVDQTTGLPVAGGGATVVQGSGDISKMVMPDGGSITWDVGSTVSGGSAGGTASAVDFWGFLAPWATILSTYRSESAPSVAFA